MLALEEGIRKEKIPAVKIYLDGMNPGGNRYPRRLTRSI